MFFGKIIFINFILNAKFQVHNFRKFKQFHDEVFPDMEALNFHMEAFLLWRFCSNILFVLICSRTCISCLDRMVDSLFINHKFIIFKVKF